MFGEQGYVMFGWLDYDTFGGQGYAMFDSQGCVMFGDQGYAMFGWQGYAMFGGLGYVMFAWQGYVMFGCQDCHVCTLCHTDGHNFYTQLLYPYFILTLLSTIEAQLLD